MCSQHGVRTLMIVGHEPTMSDLTLEMARDDRKSALDRVRDKFPTAAIAILAFPGNWPELGPGKAKLDNFVVPDDLRTLMAKADRGGTRCAVPPTSSRGTSTNARQSRRSANGHVTVLTPSPCGVLSRLVVPCRSVTSYRECSRWAAAAKGFAHRTEAKHKRRQWLPACHGPRVPWLSGRDLRMGGCVPCRTQLVRWDRVGRRVL